jgi:hypothetical protein
MPPFTGLTLFDCVLCVLSQRSQVERELAEIDTQHHYLVKKTKEATDAIDFEDIILSGTTKEHLTDSISKIIEKMADLRSRKMVQYSLLGKAFEHENSV